MKIQADSGDLAGAIVTDMNISPDIDEVRVEMKTATGIEFTFVFTDAEFRALEKVVTFTVKNNMPVKTLKITYDNMPDDE